MRTRRLTALVVASLITSGTVVALVASPGPLRVAFQRNEARVAHSPYVPATTLTGLRTVTAFRWFHQFGTPTADEAHGVAVDWSGIYVAGSTGGSPDVFLRRYDHNSNLIWIRQFGTAEDDLARAIAVDGSGVYIAGYTRIPDQGGFGDDAFLWKYDVDGNLVWNRTFGTPQFDYAFAVALDASGIYVGGQTFGTFPDQTNMGSGYVRKYDHDGNAVWTRQFDTSGPDGANALAVGAGGLIVAGWKGSVPSRAFLGKYNFNGTPEWTRQFGSSETNGATAVAFNGSSVYVAGRAGLDAFLRKYDSDGNVVWSREFGAPEEDTAWGVAVNGFGAYVAGHTQGTLPGELSAGGYDAFVRKYDVAGTELWTHQFGTSGNDLAWAATADGSSVYLAGYTDGTFPGQTGAGGQDAFLAAIDTVPPTIAMTSPQNGTTLRSATVSVTGTASDDVAVERVEVSVDGTTWLLTTGTTAWFANLTLREGLNTITARASDTTRNVGTTTVMVIMQGERVFLLLLVAGVGSLAVSVVAVLYILRRRKRKGVHPPKEPPPPVQ